MRFYSNGSPTFLPPPLSQSPSPPIAPSPHLSAPQSPLFRSLTRVEDTQVHCFFNRLTALADVELPVDVPQV
jgi:hypothetical protein